MYVMAKRVFVKEKGWSNKFAKKLEYILSSFLLSFHFACVWDSMNVYMNEQNYTEGKVFSIKKKKKK